MRDDVVSKLLRVVLVPVIVASSAMVLSGCGDDAAKPSSSVGTAARNAVGQGGAEGKWKTP